MKKNDGLWITGFSALYMAAFFEAILHFKLPVFDLVPVTIIFGVALPIITLLLLQKAKPSLITKPRLKREWIVLAGLVFWIAGYILYGPALLNALLPAKVASDGQWQFVIVILRKLFVFVLVPFGIYRMLGFSTKDFGFGINSKEIFSRRIIVAFVILSVCLLSFQYFWSGGGSALRRGEFSISQLVVSLPLAFIWLFVEVGLVEEFFFRALLQSRLAAIFKSPAAGIFISVLIFGLVHAPGLYLRGASSEGIAEKLPIGFWITYCIVNMSTAGIFLGVAWSRSKNVYLIMALHVVTDLIPNLKDFIQTWHL